MITCCVRTAMRAASSCLVVWFAVDSVLAAEPVAVRRPRQADDVVINKDPTTITIQMDALDGQLPWSHLARACARLEGYDDSLFVQLPPTAIDLDGSTASWLRQQFNAWCAPCFRCDVTENARGGKTVQIVVNRQEVQQASRLLQRNVRWTLSSPSERQANYGLKLIDSPDHAQQIAVLIHGLNSSPQDLAAWLPVCRRAGMACATFAYPNDQPINDSAQLLRSELADLQRKLPQHTVRLVAHSMGGLVARGAIEGRDAACGNVRQLIMVGTPNHGSNLARVVGCLECYEFLCDSRNIRPNMVSNSIADGLGEAGADLIPGSVFLDGLNALSRNPRVCYTNILGHSGPMPEYQRDNFCRSVRQCLSTHETLQFLGSKLVNSLEALDEVIAGKGDGVVSIHSGRLAGVADEVVLANNHAGFLSCGSEATEFQEVLAAKIANALKAD